MIELDISTGVEARDLELDDRVVASDGRVIEVDEVGVRRDGVHVYGWQVGVPAGSRRTRLEFKPGEVVKVLPGGDQLQQLFAALHACVFRAEAAHDEAEADAHEDPDVRTASPWQIAGTEAVLLRAGARTWTIELRTLPDPELPQVLSPGQAADATADEG